MDNNVIKCDIDFGSSLFDDDQPNLGFNSKESPSHQSDSGCSDMSEDIRSVSPACTMSSILEFDPFECDSTEQDLDRELEMYFASPVVHVQSDDTAKCKIGNKIDTPVVIVDEPVSETENCPEDSSDEDYVPPVRGTKSKVNISKPRGGGKVKPRLVESNSVVSANSISQVPQNVVSAIAAKTPAVKVVKIIKTPASSKDEINYSIMQALDERNKKNAVQAKINREKKKAYIKNLEDEIDGLKNENLILKETNRKSAQEKSALEREVEYLRSVLANDSALSGLLKNINTVQNVKLSSTFSKKRGAEHDHDYQPRKKARVGAGVCLHVDQGNVSLEFCSKCSSMSNHAADKS